MISQITDWVATPNKLQITVAVEPLGMTSTYVRAYHGTNHYGQDMKWSWWHVREDGIGAEVYGAGGQGHLTSLVVNHKPLSLLTDRYNI